MKQQKIVLLILLFPFVCFSQIVDSSLLGKWRIVTVDFANGEFYYDVKKDSVFISEARQEIAKNFAEKFESESDPILQMKRDIQSGYKNCVYTFDKNGNHDIIPDAIGKLKYKINSEKNSIEILDSENSGQTTLIQYKIQGNKLFLLIEIPNIGELKKEDSNIKLLLEKFNG